MPFNLNFCRRLSRINAPLYFYLIEIFIDMCISIYINEYTYEHDVYNHVYIYSYAYMYTKLIMYIYIHICIYKGNIYGEKYDSNLYSNCPIDKPLIFAYIKILFHAIRSTNSFPNIRSVT